MNYAYRIRQRIAEEGIGKTIQYFFFVFFYCLRENIYEVVYDLHYSRRYLKGNCKTIYKHLGANDIYHTKYSVMPHIFNCIRIRKQDVLVDVGCGKGRIINYWLSRRLKNKIIGLELDPKVARCTGEQFARWKNVTIRQGDAIKNLPENGTIFYFYNPFTEDKVREFEQTMKEKFGTRPIKIIYYNPKSIHVFQNGNWRIRYVNFERDLGLKRWGRINKYHDLAIIRNMRQ